MPFPKIFAPILPGATFTDRAWACLGALAGIGVTALLGLFSFGRDPHLPFLVAPLGASAVLVFAVPTSPLAQPWSVVGGNTIGALVGIAVARFVSDPALACGLAVALAIAAMSLARCLHPPGGAAALTGVLGGPMVAAASFTFAFTPMALDSIMLVLTGVLFHRVSRHRYPHRAARPPVNPHGTGDRSPEQRVGFDTRDVDAALADIGETFDIDRADLDVLLRRIELRAVARQSGDPSCADVMSRDLVTIGLHANLDAARGLMLWHAIRSLPVIGEKGRLVGMVTLAELARAPAKVRDVMRAPLTVKPGSSAFDLVGRLSDGRSHAAVVIDEDMRPIGMITQTDLLAALVHRPSVPASTAA